MLLDQLRQATRALHTELETVMYSQQISDLSLTKPQLIHLQLINYHFFSFVEPYINGLTAFDVQRSALIFNDLKQMSVVIDLNPVAFPIKDISESHAIGITYVTLGSTLGGRIIGKKLQENNNLDNASYSFYQETKKDLIEWKKFKAHIESHNPDYIVDSVIDAAKAAFNYFKMLNATIELPK